MGKIPWGGLIPTYESIFIDLFVGRNPLPLRTPPKIGMRFPALAVQLQGFTHSTEKITGVVKGEGFSFRRPDSSVESGLGLLLPYCRIEKRNPAYERSGMVRDYSNADNGDGVGRGS